MKKLIVGFLSVCITLFVAVLGEIFPGMQELGSENESAMEYEVPEYAGEIYTEINENVPFFTQKEMTTKSFETYSNLDWLGRCGSAYANVGKELMPTEERGPIGMVKPSGWHTVKYPEVIEDLWF